MFHVPVPGQIIYYFLLKPPFRNNDKRSQRQKKSKMAKTVFTSMLFQDITNHHHLHRKGGDNILDSMLCPQLLQMPNVILVPVCLKYPLQLFTKVTVIQYQGQFCNSNSPFTNIPATKHLSFHWELEKWWAKSTSKERGQQQQMKPRYWPHGQCPLYISIIIITV